MTFLALQTKKLSFPEWQRRISLNRHNSVSFAVGKLRFSGQKVTRVVCTIFQKNTNFGYVICDSFLIKSAQKPRFYLFYFPRY